MEDKLNQLLASYQIHYQNLRSLHWNIKGVGFFELHLKYEELYTRTQIIIDEIAERILTLGFQPLSRFSDYISKSVLKENNVIHNGKNGVKYVFQAQTKILELEKELLVLNEEDEGTNSLLSDLIREKEKTNWMFKAWMS